jgi:predicted nucleic acid-binding protein
MESTPMPRYVIDPDVALHLAARRIAVPDEHQILAPTLLRSQLLSLLYRMVRRGEITRGEADERLDYVRRLRIRLLGDRVLQQVAWKMAERLGWPDTRDAEYLALTHLQADAFVTSNEELARSVIGVVPTASVEVLSRTGEAGETVVQVPDPDRPRS